MRFTSKEQQAAVMSQYTKDPVKGSRMPGKVSWVSLQSPLRTEKYKGNTIAFLKQSAKGDIEAISTVKGVTYSMSCPTKERAKTEMKRLIDDVTRQGHTLAYRSNVEMKSWDAYNKAIQKKAMSYPALKAQGHQFKTSDDDRDGVPNSKDCKPLDPKKQGLMHELEKKALAVKDAATGVSGKVKKAWVEGKASMEERRIQNMEKELKEKEERLQEYSQREKMLASRDEPLRMAEARELKDRERLEALRQKSAALDKELAQKSPWQKAKRTIIDYSSKLNRATSQKRRRNAPRKSRELVLFDVK